MRWFFALAMAGLISSEAPALAEAETLIAPQPGPGWTQATRELNPKALTNVFVREGETLENWSEMFTVKIWRQPPFNHRQIAERMRENLEQAGTCKDLSFQELENRKVNGYDATLYALSCAEYRRMPKSEYVYLLNIQGKDAVYSLQRAVRGAPFASGTQPVP